MVDKLQSIQHTLEANMSKTKNFSRKAAASMDDLLKSDRMSDKMKEQFKKIHQMDRNSFDKLRACERGLYG